MLLVASFSLIAVQRGSLTNGLDESLRQSADNLAPLLSSSSDLPAVGDPEDNFIQVLGGRGQVVNATPNASERPAVDVTGGHTGTSIRTARVSSPTGSFRVLTRALDDGTTLVIGRNLDDVDESVQVLVAALAIVSPALLLLLGGLSWWLVGRTLQPVADIRREVEAIGGRELHRRVPVPSTADEIATLALTMNAMLARVEAASDRQSRFVDDASHELRTPLTRMITDLDVAVAHPDAEDPNQTLRRVHTAAEEMRILLEDLLFLARGSDQPVTDADVDLDDIALVVAGQARETSSITVDTSGVTATSVRGDRRALTRALANIMANAVRHARSTVSISVLADEGDPVMVVDDDGDGIAPPDRDRIFERFVRLDESRARHDGGAGLGLAIAREVVVRHRGTIEVTDSPSGGARFVVRFPLSRSSPSATPDAAPLEPADDPG